MFQTAFSGCLKAQGSLKPAKPARHPNHKKAA